MAKQYKFPPGEFTTTQWVDLNGWRLSNESMRRARKIIAAHGYEFRSVPSPKIPWRCNASPFERQLRKRLWSKQSTVSAVRND